MQKKVLKLPSVGNFPGDSKMYRKFQRKRPIPEYFILRKYLSEYVFNARGDNPRDMAIVLAFCMNVSVGEICSTFGLTREEFLSIHLPRCLKAKMAMFAELQCALFISAIYDRNLEAIKLLLNTLTGTITDLKACGLSQLLNFTDYRNFDDEAIKETKMYKKWCQIMNEKEGLLEELIFDYEKLVSDILAEKKIYEDVDTQVQEFLAELEEKVLVNRILKNNANDV